MKRALSTFMFVLLLVSMLTMAFGIQPVKASGTVYIRADGSIDPSSASIQRVGDIYTFTDNINASIVVEKDNIVVDGASYTLQGEDFIGIYLSGRSNVTIKDMEITAFRYGIALWEYSNNNSIFGNDVTDNNLGICVGAHGGSNNNIYGNNITGNHECGAGLYDDSYNNSIFGNNITNNGNGIDVVSSNNSNIFGNNIIASDYGIGLYDSSNNSIVGNNIANNGYGIGLYGSTSNSVSNNNIANNLDGIYFDSSSSNSISGNNITANGGNGIWLSYSPNSNISGNNITNNEWGVYLDYSSGSSTSGNNITANDFCGIALDSSSNNIVSGNNITANDLDGIALGYSSSNIVSGNNIINNGYGIWLWSSSNSSIFHNNLINNSYQVTNYGGANVWDDGYPSGGNYWSDYTGVDSYSGPFRNVTGSDGMGDTPYVVDADNRDNFPLMNPWPLGWKLDFAAPTNHPIVDFAVYNGSLYAAADNKLYVKDGSIWSVIDTPTFVTSLETVNVTNRGPPTTDWNRTYGGTSDDYAYALVQTTDGGYALAGWTASVVAGSHDFWLVKTDADGNEQWNNAYGGANWDQAYALVQTADGGYALAGFTYSFGAGDGDFWLVKTDSNGNMQWNKTYGGTNMDNALALVQTNDDGYALAGVTTSFGAGSYDFWLVKTDAAGNAQWNRTYGGTNGDITEALVQTSDGGYALAGRTLSFGAGMWDFWLVKTDATGNAQWNRTYGGLSDDWAFALVQTSDGGYALAGTKDLYVASGGDFWLVETDANGIMQWNQTYGGANSDEASSLVHTMEGGYAIAGCTASFGAGDKDFWLVKTEAFDPYLEEELVIGGKGGLYCYDGTSFSLIFSVPTYIKVLGAYNNTLYAGTMLDNPPKLYYCNGPPENPANWYEDSGFSSVLNFSGAFGSIDSFWASNSNMGAPVGYWKFDEGAGSVAFDSSGNNFDGTVNGANWTDGILNKALEFDGQDDYVEVLDSTELNPPAITVAAWVNFKGFPEPGENGWRNSVIVSKGTDVLVDGNYVLLAQFVNEAHMYFQITEQGQYTWVGGNTTIAENVWYYVVGTYDGSVLRVYVNGVLDGETVLNTQRTSNTGNLQIGAMRILGNGYWTNGTIDEVKIYGYAKTSEEIWNDYLSGIGNMYVASGNSVYCYDGANWSVAVRYDDVSAFLAMKSYNGKLYLATRDQGWRKPFYQGGTGFSGRVIEFNGTSWTTVLDHDYWVYSLEVYDDKLYAGTANQIFTYNGTDWETSFNATEGAYYAIAMINYDGKIYAGMGNGYIFADPAPAKTEQETITVPEYSSITILAIFMAMTMLAAALTKRNWIRRFC